MTLALLHLYGRVGDTRAVRHIKRLVRARPTENTLEAQQVREAAIDALENMKRRSPAWDTASTHLRPSSAPEATNEELLIPAGEAPPTNAQELLRASAQKEEKETAE